MQHGRKQNGNGCAAKTIDFFFEGFNYWGDPFYCMAAKKYAIPLSAANIALRYGSNVSKGIQAMDRIIEKLTHPTKEDAPDE